MNAHTTPRPLDDFLKSFGGYVDDCVAKTSALRWPTQIADQCTALLDRLSRVEKALERIDRELPYLDQAAGDTKSVHEAVSDAQTDLFDAITQTKDLRDRVDALYDNAERSMRVALEMSDEAQYQEGELARTQTGPAFQRIFERQLTRNPSEALALLEDPDCAAGCASLDPNVLAGLLSNDAPADLRERAIRVLHRLQASPQSKPSRQRARAR